MKLYVLFAFFAVTLAIHPWIPQKAEFLDPRPHEDECSSNDQCAANHECLITFTAGGMAQTRMCVEKEQVINPVCRTDGDCTDGKKCKKLRLKPMKIYLMMCQNP